MKTHTTYPYWFVGGFRCTTMDEARLLAREIASRENREILIMEKLDAHTPTYIVETIFPG